MDTLTSRLDRMERELAALRRSRLRYRAAGILAVAAATVITVTGWTTGAADVIRARRFELISQSGQVIAKLDQSATGGGALRLMTDAGHTAVDLYGDHLMRGLTVYDEKDSLVANMIYIPGLASRITAYGIDRRSSIEFRSEAASPRMDARIVAAGREVWRAK